MTHHFFIAYSRIYRTHRLCSGMKKKENRTFTTNVVRFITTNVVYGSGAVFPSLFSFYYYSIATRATPPAPSRYVKREESTCFEWRLVKLLALLQWQSAEFAPISLSPRYVNCFSRIVCKGRRTTLLFKCIPLWEMRLQLSFQPWISKLLVRRLSISNVCSFLEWVQYLDVSAGRILSILYTSNLCRIFCLSVI